eukprot:m.216833 g.216833  ORF g.216833 m.216833 type:complete len:444 (-) comp18661_c2_seq2:228-1559(-)
MSEAGEGAEAPSGPLNESRWLPRVQPATRQLLPMDLRKWSVASPTIVAIVGIAAPVFAVIYLPQHAVLSALAATWSLLRPAVSSGGGDVKGRGGIDADEKAVADDEPDTNTAVAANPVWTFADRVDRAFYSHYTAFVRLFFESLAGVTYIYSGDRPQATDARALCLSNHQCTLDWFVWTQVAREHNLPGHVQYVLKDTLKLMPLYGWYLGMHGSVYVSRCSSGADVVRLSGCVDRLFATETPAWLVLFPEGTRYRVRCPALTSSLQFQTDHGFTPTGHVLHPRSKGFISCLEGLRRHKGVVIDATIAYTRGAPDGSRPHAPSMPELMASRHKEVHVHLRRFNVADLPQDHAALSQWLVDLFVEKDRLLRDFYDGKGFPAEQWQRPVPRSETAWRTLLYAGLCLPFFVTRPGWRTFVGMWVVGGLGGMGLQGLAILYDRRVRSH